MTTHRAARRGRRGLLLGLVAALVVGSAATAFAWQQREPSARPAEAQVDATESAPPEDRTWGPTDAEQQDAEQKAAGLTLEELAGQLIVARHFSEEQSLVLVRDRHFAGVMVTGQRALDVGADPLASVKAFNDQLRTVGEERDVPVVIPIDQEGGLITRLGSAATSFPTFMSAGAAIGGDPAAARTVTAAARANGTEMKALGFNVVFAPDGDVTIGPDDPVIGSRSAGSDPAVVGQAVAAAVEGYSEAGIISSVKHFPGHNVDEDSHEALPVLRSDLARLRAHDLPPFVAAIEAGVPSIMTGHLDVRAIHEGVPASLSRPVVTDVLRDELGYDGLVVSDALGMAAVMKSHPGGEAAVEAIKAGSDLALMPADNEAAYDAMLAALKSGDLPEAQARASAARTIGWLTHADASPRLPGGPASHDQQSQALSAAAVSVVTRSCDRTTPTSFRPQGSPELVQAFTEAAQDAGVPLGGGPSVLLLSYGSAGGTGDVVVTTDTPYALDASTAPTKVALYGAGKPAMAALVDVLIGKAKATGKVPVDGLTSKQQPC